MMKLFIFALFLIISTMTASATTYYVRPHVVGGYGTGDGLSYANAYNGFVGAGNPASGSYMLVCGSFLSDSARAPGSYMILVNVGNVTWDGDCSGSGDLSMAVINGENITERCIDSGSGGATSVTLKNIEVKNCNSGSVGFGIISQGDATIARNWIIDNLYIHDIRCLNCECIWSRQKGLTIRNSHIKNCGNDAIYAEGDNFTVTGCLIEDPGLDTGVTDGDGIQLSRFLDNWYINNNIIRMSQDVKQCVLVGPGTSGTMNGTLSNTMCYGPSATAQAHNAFAFGGLTGTINIFNNYVEKSRYLIYNAVGFTDMIAYNNIGRQVSNVGIQCGTNSGNCTLYNNSVYDSKYGIYTAASGGKNSSINSNEISTASATGIYTDVALRTVQNNNAVFNAPVIFQMAGLVTPLGDTGVLQDPLLTNPSVSGPDGMAPTEMSPLIDAGVANALRTTDYYGNPIYGLPDIGAIEYQPTRVIGIDAINPNRALRIYGDGKYRYTLDGAAGTADFVITPTGGSFPSFGATEARPAWMEISNITWNSQDRQWTSKGLGAGNVIFNVGGLTALDYYKVVRDGGPTSSITGATCTKSICKTDGTGKLTFTYSGGWASSHVFHVFLPIGRGYEKSLRLKRR